MSRDIQELETTGQAMRVQWRKANGYFAALARTFTDLKGEFARGNYGNQTFGAWLGMNAGLSETQLTRMLDLFKTGIAGDARDLVAAELAQQASAKRQAKLREGEEKAALRAQQAAAKQTRSEDALQRLLERAQQAAAAVRTAETAQSIEGRRRIHLDYGRSLLALRKDEASKNRFHNLLIEHKLEVRTPGFRSDAMWLAEHWDDLLTRVRQCPHADPTHIRTWLRRQDNPSGTSKTTRVGKTPRAQQARALVRPLVEAGEPISVLALNKETGISRVVLEAAIAAERERFELTRAPVTRHFPLSSDEFAQVTSALHEEQTNPHRRSVALGILMGKRTELTGHGEVVRLVASR